MHDAEIADQPNFLDVEAAARVSTTLRLFHHGLPYLRANAAPDHFQPSALPLHLWATKLAPEIYVAA
jgi:hypothetical protein